MLSEWNGIKAGGLYKRRGRGSRSAPLLQVVSIRPRRDEGGEYVEVTVQESGERDTWNYWSGKVTLAFDSYEHSAVQERRWAGDSFSRRGEYIRYHQWPYAACEPQ